MVLNIVSQSEILSCFFIFGAGCLNALWTVETDYLKEQGITWLQMFFISQATTLVYASLYWICTMSWQYYHKFESISDEYTYIRYLMSIFPSFNKSNSFVWTHLISRGVIAATGFQFYIIGLKYCQSGDAMVIRGVMLSLGLITVGKLYFKEEINAYILIALLLCILSLVLIVQPSFIFNHGSNAVSWIGLLFLFISTIFRVASKSMIRHSSDLDVHWLAVILVGLISGFIEVSFIFAIMAIGFYIKNGNINTIWWDWTSTGSKNIEINSILIYTFGMVEAGQTLFSIAGYQIGSVAILGVIDNCDIPTAYILGNIILNETDNYITYIGICIAFIALMILFWQQWKRARQRQELELQQNESEWNINSNDHEYEVV